MEGEMRSDVDLLLNLVDANPPLVQYHGACIPLSRKLIAGWAGVSIQTVSDYCTGKTNIPVDFWRRLFERIQDYRIAALVLGDLLDWELQVHGQFNPQTGTDFFRFAVEESGKHHEKQTYIATLLRDGRIDELDASTIQQYHDAYVAHRQLDAQLHYAIVHKYQQVMAVREIS